ncbi:brachyurin-like [Cloeon dipterum]|uniref:brachyurin-like n=1 Tax=Cloeon dipterum TaxID=197152 RepID=UPI00322054F5
MRSFVGIVILVLLANVSAKDAVRVELPANTVNLRFKIFDLYTCEFYFLKEKLEKEAVPVNKTEEKEYTLEELLGEDNVTAIEALLEADKKRHNSTQALAAALAAAGSKSAEVVNRILGGDLVVPGEQTFNAFLVTVPVSGPARICGGALLSAQWVLTAAQCVAGSALIQVVAGPSTSVGVPFVHPKFVLNFLLNDIALVKLATPTTLGAFASTIRLSTATTTSMDNVQLRTFGIGASDNTIGVSGPLQFVDMTNVKKSECLSQTASFFVAYPTNTGCLSTAGGTKGFCSSDAGSPVVHIDEAEGTTTLYGLNSLSLGCPSQYPSAYTLVQPYITWIKLTTNLKTLT